MNPFATHTWLMYDAQNTLISLKVDAYSGDKKLGINSADDLDAIDATNATNAIRELGEKCDGFNNLLETIRSGGRLEYWTMAEGRARAKFIGETAVPIAPPTVIIQTLCGSVSSVTHNLEPRTQFVLLDHESDDNSERDESITLDGQRVESAIVYGKSNAQVCAEILELASAAKAAALTATNTDNNWPAEHPDHPLGDWRLEVRNGDTRLGYDAWLKHQLDAKR